MADLISREKVIRFIKSPKVGYKVPEFFIERLDNIPATDEFIKKHYTEQDEIPLWWSRDVDLPLTKKETKHTQKEALAIQRTFTQQQKRLNRANNQYKVLLQKQQEEFKKRCQELDKQIEIKREELEMLFQHNKLEYENKLLELELELQQINREKEYYQREQKRINELQEQKKKYEIKEQKWERKVSKLEESVSQGIEENRKLKQEIEKEHGKSALEKAKEVVEPKNDSEKDLPEKSLKGKEKAKTKDKGLSDENKEYYGEFDCENILESKHITLTNKETGYNELYNISFNVKKSGVTVVYSKSQRLLSNLYQVIMNKLPRTMKVTRGAIRLDGEDMYDILRFRQRSKSLVISLAQIQENLSHSSKRLRLAMKGYKINTSKLITLIELMGLDKSIRSVKLNKIKSEQKEKLAMAVLFSADTALKILFQPQQDMKEEQKEILINLVNHNRLASQLILTTDKTFAVSLDNSSLYIL